MSWYLLNKFEKKESDGLTNLLGTLHLPLVISPIGIKEITEHTSKDPILNELRKLMKSAKNFLIFPKANPI